MAEGLRANRTLLEPGLWARLAVLCGCASLLGCASTQIIGLNVEPNPVAVFVDGKRVDESPGSVELSANRDHTLFFQREGYRSQLIILRTAERDGQDYLVPGHIEITLKRETDSAPSVSVELDESEDPPRAP